ncbi:terminase small subunit [Arhodomonas sp. SL1]|uniref:terminase small subunit n=1 Tax=Arhodomonas sp. SL1 TaxID=3425691 RepID=UPI003F88339A
MARITDKQEAFAREYLVDLNASQAAIRAGYSLKTAGQVGHQLLGKPAVAERIAELKAERERRLEVNADTVVRELARIGLMDPRKLFHADGTPRAVTELDDATAAAIHSLEVARIGNSEVEVGQVLKYRLSDKVAALDKLMKHFGMYEQDNRQRGDPMREFLEAIAQAPESTPAGRIKASEAARVGDSGGTE